MSDLYVGPMNPAEAQKRADEARAKPEDQRRSRYEDLATDALGGIANGAENPQEIARIVMRLGADIYEPAPDGERDMWITWPEGPA